MRSSKVKLIVVIKGSHKAWDFMFWNRRKSLIWEQGRSLPVCRHGSFQGASCTVSYNLGSPWVGDIAVGGLCGDLECPWVWVCPWLCACSVHPLQGHFCHRVRSNPTGQSRRQGKFRSLYPWKSRFWTPLVISGVIVLFFSVLMPSVQEKGQ